VESLIGSHRLGRQSTLEPEEVAAFYAASVSASGGRVVLRDWLETTLSNAYRNLARYFLLQKLPHQEPFSLSRLRQSLTPPRSSRTTDQRDSLPAIITRWLVRCALLGGTLPHGLLYQAVRRNRAEQGVTPARAALIKMVLLSPLADESINQEGHMDNDTRHQPAYLCGRLLALLEQAQAAALGNPNTTLVDRFYGAASSTPASVFGLLLKNAQAHLSKLRHEREGTYYYLQRELGQVMEQLPGFPYTLDLRKQGLFALGYYYQRQERFRRRDAAEPLLDSVAEKGDE
jgi:CRISPR-associated protein Csd1